MARLLPPESAPLEVVSREVGVSADTLERWRSEALAQPVQQRTWTAAARLEAVISTAAMDEAARNAWCREHGVYPQLSAPAGTHVRRRAAGRPRRFQGARWSMI